eukprot:6304101-Alexandrium_andersonii.AAC.1
MCIRDSHQVDSLASAAMLSVARYEPLVSKWFRSVVLRPVASSDPVGRARIAALTVDSTKQRTVLAGEGCDVDRVRRAAAARARAAFAAAE